jgi:hypothetical protein
LPLNRATFDHKVAGWLLDSSHHVQPGLQRQLPELGNSPVLAS